MQYYRRVTGILPSILSSCVTLGLTALRDERVKVDGCTSWHEGTAAHIPAAATSAAPLQAGGFPLTAICLFHTLYISSAAGSLAGL